MISIERRITDGKRLIDLTVGELKEILMNIGVPANEEPHERHYAYGIDGLAQTLHVSRSYANKLKKSGKLDRAIKQEGRKIMIDVEMAVELFGKK